MNVGQIQTSTTYKSYGALVAAELFKGQGTPCQLPPTVGCGILMLRGSWSGSKLLGH